MYSYPMLISKGLNQSHYPPNMAIVHIRAQKIPKSENDHNSITSQGAKLKIMLSNLKLSIKHLKFKNIKP